MENKKQLFNLVTDICRLNSSWGNKSGSYDAHRAAALLIEEALEAISSAVPRSQAREVVANWALEDDPNTDDIRAFDALLDSIYIAVGELHKLGLTPHQMTDGLQAVHMANLQKSGAKDANGKVTKPDNFIGPEATLQAILDRRV